ncbi:MAG TPA: GNAT family N-acetyltransferase [Nocardioidaceae bacterium]|jgi:ribosomal protein S18 acetylase RimI-like enzyme|nr:GNAT family N-acetyltransferase [Nocardioidaceae bacterium]
MPEAIVIRQRTVLDLGACARVLKSVHRTFGYPVNWPADPVRWLSPQEDINAWVATADARVVGHLALAARPSARPAREAMVERFFVDPTSTGLGIGRRLLDHGLASARAQALDVALEVADNCQAAVELYRRAGWRETAQMPIDWGRDKASTLLRFEPPTPTESRPL